MSLIFSSFVPNALHTAICNEYNVALGRVRLTMKIVWSWGTSLSACTHAGQHGTWEGAHVAFVDLFDNLQLRLRRRILWPREVANQHNTSALGGDDVRVVQLRVAPNHFFANSVRVGLMFSASD